MVAATPIALFAGTVEAAGDPAQTEFRLTPEVVSNPAGPPTVLGEDAPPALYRPETISGRDQLWSYLTKQLNPFLPSGLVVLLISGVFALLNFRIELPKHVRMSWLHAPYLLAWIAVEYLVCLTILWQVAPEELRHLSPRLVWACLAATLSVGIASNLKLHLGPLEWPLDLYRYKRIAAERILRNAQERSDRVDRRHSLVLRCLTAKQLLGMLVGLGKDGDLTAEQQDVLDDVLRDLEGAAEATDAERYVFRLAATPALLRRVLDRYAQSLAPVQGVPRVRLLEAFHPLLTVAQANALVDAGFGSIRQIAALAGDEARLGDAADRAGVDRSILRDLAWLALEMRRKIWRRRLVGGAMASAFMLALVLLIGQVGVTVGSIRLGAEGPLPQAGHTGAAPRGANVPEAPT